MRVNVAGQSDPGQRRSLNEDAWWIAEESDTGAMWAQRGRLFVVADGMGGHAAGEVASQLAVETLIQVYYGGDEALLSPAMRLEQAIQTANRRVYEQAATQDAQAGMGTTVVAAVVHDSWLTIANVGDSRAYRVRSGQAEQITRDHSWVAEQVIAGTLTREEAQNHIYKNVVTRCLGHRPTVQIDVFEQPLQVGDIVLLCSDGLSNQVSDLELAATLTQPAANMAGAVNELIRLANERGGPDNITAIAFQVVSLPAEEEQGEPTIPATSPSNQATLVVPAKTTGARTVVTQRPVEPLDRHRPAVRRRKGSRLRVIVLAALAVWGIVLCVAAVPLMMSRWTFIRDWLGWPVATSTARPPGTMTLPVPSSVTPTTAASPVSTATVLHTPTTALTTAPTATITSTTTPTLPLTVTLTASSTATRSPTSSLTTSPTATLTVTATHAP